MVQPSGHCVLAGWQSTRHTVNSSQPKIVWRVDRLFVTSWPCDESTVWRVDLWRVDLWRVDRVTSWLVATTSNNIGPCLQTRDPNFKSVTHLTITYVISLPPLVLDILKFIIRAERAQNRVEWSGAVRSSCWKMMEWSRARSRRSRSGNGAGLNYRNRLDRGAAFSPFTLHSHALVRGHCRRRTV